MMLSLFNFAVTLEVVANVSFEFYGEEISTDPQIHASRKAESKGKKALVRFYLGTISGNSLICATIMLLVGLSKYWFQNITEL